MTTQQSSPGTENPEVDLQPLAFMKTFDDDKKAVFQAKIGDIKVPEQPVLELTATLASPAGDEKAAREITEFLDEIRAGFTLRSPTPEDDQDGIQKADAFNVNNGILFDAELIRPDTSKGPVYVTLVVQTAIDGYTRPEQVPVALAGGVLRVSAWLTRLRAQPLRVIYQSGSVLKGATHQYTSKAKKMRATVTSRSGSARVSPGYHKINRGGSTTVTAKTVTVYGVSKKCYYRIREDF